MPVPVTTITLSTTDPTLKLTQAGLTSALLTLGSLTAVQGVSQVGSASWDLAGLGAISSVSGSVACVISGQAATLPILVTISAGGGVAQAGIAYTFGPPCAVIEDALVPLVPGGSVYVPVLKAVTESSGAAHDPASDQFDCALTDGDAPASTVAGSAIRSGGYVQFTPGALPGGRAVGVVWVNGRAVGVVGIL